MISSQTAARNDNHIVKEVMRANPHTVEGRRNCPFVINSFNRFTKDLPEGGEKEVTGLALLAINAFTLDRLNLVKIIAEKRLVNIVTVNGELKEVHVHPDWMENIRKHNAFELLLKTSFDEDFGLSKDTPGIGSLETHANYIGMVTRLGFGKLIKV